VKKRKKLGIVIAALLATTAVTASTNASAAELMTQIQSIKEALDLIKFGMDMYGQYSEATGKLGRLNPTPDQAAENLNAIAKHAESFHPQEFLKPPTLNADQALSQNKAERDEA
jgi:hypothetical protein